MTETETLSHGRVARILERFADLRLLVLGDVMLDEYLNGRVERTSPEAPVPVVKAERETSSLGGAANVAHLAAVLGAKAELFGVVGADAAGERVRAQCEVAGIDASNVLAVEGRPTTRKVRVLAQHQHVLRIDWEEHRTISEELSTEVVERLRACERPDALVISDYAKGFLSPTVLEGAIAAAREWGVPILVDPKYADLSRYRGATVIKANQKEFEAAIGYSISDDLEQELTNASSLVLETIDSQVLIVTLGEKGLAVFPRGQQPLFVPTAARDVYDVSGAGDTVTAVMAVALAVGATPFEAAVLANHSAAVEVGKAGVATVSPREILRQLEAFVEKEPS